MKTSILFILFFFAINSSFAVIRIVDINGGGNYTSINSAIQASAAGDTVKVWPGLYNQQVNLDRDIVLMGSGYENTIISSDVDPSINMSDGKILWFAITSTYNGIIATHGIIANCVIRGCQYNGLLIAENSDVIVTNSVFCSNGESGVEVIGSNTAIIYNSISLSNGKIGFTGVCVSYSCASWNPYWVPNPNFYLIACDVGNTMDDPLINCSGDIHPPISSICVDGGKPDVLDPDGSRSDIGYFGGPDAPTYPVVVDMKLIPLPNGGVRVQAKGKSNY